MEALSALAKEDTIHAFVYSLKLYLREYIEA